MIEIAEYCCYDVKITKLVHEYGCSQRQLHYNNRFGKTDRAGEVGDLNLEIRNSRNATAFCLFLISEFQIKT